jgi:predicted tellurium resistance membrane protein TerC
LISGSLAEEAGMAWIYSPESWLALVTLTVLEIVLGIDNIVFISILAGKLPTAQQRRARNLGLTLAMITRILLLLSLTWIMRLTTPLFEGCRTRIFWARSDSHSWRSFPALEECA